MSADLPFSSWKPFRHTAGELVPVDWRRVEFVQGLLTEPMGKPDLLIAELCFQLQVRGRALWAGGQRG